MKHAILLISLINLTSISAQNTFKDFVVTKSNDTIYGAIKKDKLQTTTKGDSGSKIISLDSIFLLRKNDEIYIRKTKNHSEEKGFIYKEYLNKFINSEKLKADFIVSKNMDTVFGKLKNPLFGSKYIKNSENFRIKLDKQNTSSYRENNSIYELKTIDTTILSREKKIFLKRLIKGAVSLYEYKVLRTDAGSVRPETFYILEKNGKLQLISNVNYKQQLVDYFIQNEALVDLIDSEFYSLSNLYLIVKRYNL